MDKTIRQNGEHKSNATWTALELKADRKYAQNDLKIAFPPGSEVMVPPKDKRHPFVTQVVNADGTLPKTD